MPDHSSADTTTGTGSRIQDRTSVVPSLTSL